MRLASVGWYLARPARLFMRGRRALHEIRHPGEPWIAPDAVRFCERQLRPDMRGFEWGSGRSTIWFARKLGHLTSVEHDVVWHAWVRSQIAARELGNVDYRLVTLDHAPEEPTRPSYEPSPAYVRAIESAPDGSLDLVVVDGHYRQACLRAALPKLKRSGWLLLDNSDWMALSDWGVPATWSIAHRSRRFMDETTIWTKP
jgi:hypothetical protein